MARLVAQQFGLARIELRLRQVGPSSRSGPAGDVKANGTIRLAAPASLRKALFRRWSAGGQLAQPSLGQSPPAPPSAARFARRSWPAAICAMAGAATAMLSTVRAVLQGGADVHGRYPVY